MKPSVRHAVAPAYLLACLLLGGSSQAIWGNLALQLAGLVITVWSFWPPAGPALSRSARQLGWLSLATLLLLLLQLVPLPPALWSAFPARAGSVEGLALLGLPRPWLPWSMTPYETLAALPSLIPPLAMLAAMLGRGAYRPDWLAGALAAGALASLALGAIQVTTGQGYLHRYSTIGSAAGFFANANALGTLLLATVPFLAALIIGMSNSTRSGRVGPWALAAGPLLVVAVGLLITRSLAALLLGVPVIFASLAMLAGRRVRRWRLLALIAVTAGLLALVGVHRLPAVTGGDNAVSASTRATIYAATADAIRDTFPVGSGAGSFARVYATHEDLGSFHGAFVNHAHNDYLEIVLELGLPGLLLLLLFLAWWASRAIAIWRGPGDLPARAATVASAAILAHSLVDFPARTAAIASVLAAAIALMADPRPHRRAPDRTAGQRPARHLSLR